MKINRFAMAFVLSAMTFSLFGADAPKKPAPPVPAVRVETVGTVDRSEPKSYVGSLVAYYDIDVIARVSGTLEKMFFTQGEVVKEGSLLFQIEDTVYAANVKSAKSTLAQMQAEYAFAQKEFNRFETLWRSKATSQTNYDSALRNLKSYEAKVEEAKAKLILAENDMKYTKIYAEKTGKIGGTFFSVGNYVTPSKGPIVNIATFDPIKINLSMSEADFFHQRQASQEGRSELKIYRADGREFTGEVKINYIDNKVDNETGTIRLQFIAKNPQEELIPGGYVTLKLSEKIPATPAVKLSALMTDGKKYFVFVVGSGNVAEKRQIEIGRQVYDLQLVTKGLKAGDKVITGGIHKVIPGAPVRPVDSAANPAK